jgi:hypothetical protein
MTSSGPDPVVGDVQPTCDWSLAAEDAGAADDEGSQDLVPVVERRQRCHADQQRQEDQSRRSGVSGVDNHAYLFFSGGETLSIVKGELYF